MSDRPRTGDVLCCGSSDARFVVLNGGSAACMPRLGGAAMVRGNRQSCSEPVSSTGQCDLQGGRRYADPATGLTLLCIQPGDGPLCYEDRPWSTGRSGSRSLPRRAGPEPRGDAGRRLELCPAGSAPKDTASSRTR
jgi:hypothetical protein